MIFLPPSHPLIRVVKTPVPLSPPEIKHDWYKADGFCVTQLIQKKLSSSVLSCDRPGRPPAQCRRPVPRWHSTQQKPLLRQSLSSLQSRFPYGLVSLSSLLTSFAPLGCASEKPSENLHPHTACLGEHGRAAAACRLQRGLCCFLLSPYAAGEDETQDSARCSPHLDVAVMSKSKLIGLVFCPACKHLLSCRLGSVLRPEHTEGDIAAKTSSK